MPITVECTDCKRAYTVDEKMLGQRVKCKGCGNVFTVDAPPPPPLSDIDPFADADFDSTPQDKPATKSAKMYNPIETGGAKPTAPPPAAPIAKRSFFSRSSDSFETSPSLIRAMYGVLALFVVFSVGLGIYWTVQGYTDVKDSHLATTTVVQIWEWISLFDVLLFALLSPLMWLGVWAASTILNFRMPDSPYLRASAVVAITAMVAGLAGLSPNLLAITLLVLLLPAIYYVLKIAFDLDWAQSGIAVAFGAGATLLGAFISNMILGMVMSGNVFSAIDTAKQIALAKPSPQSSQASASTDSDTTDSTPPLPATQDPAAYERFKELVREKGSADISQAMREDQMPILLDLKRQLASLKVAFHDQPDWPDQVRAIDTFEQRILSLPSGKLSDDIYTDALDADDWSTGMLSRGKLGPEVSFRQFKFQPPLEMKLDLKSSEQNPDGLIWTSSSHLDARLSIRTIRRKEPRQRRVAISKIPVVIHAAESKGLLAMNGDNVSATVGQINGMTATRVIANDGSRTAQYYIPAGDEWLIISATPSGDPKFAKVVDAAARTVREIDTGETVADPFAADRIAPRLVDDYEHASAILLRAGDAGEDAVAALLLSDDHNLKQQALTWLKDHATNRSLTALRHVALDPDTGLADMAKLAIGHLGGVADTQPDKPAASQPAVASNGGPVTPGKVSAVGGILDELKSKDAAIRKQAVKKLSLIPPVDSQRRAVSAKLASMLRNRDQCASIDEYAQALIVWGDTGVGPDLLPLLKEGGDAEARHAAMKIYVALKLPGAATVIAKWLKGDPAPAANALVDIGPNAEPAVIACLKDSEPGVRVEAARLLSQIGTRKCLAELAHAAKDARDPGAQQSAKSALEAVKARVGNDAGAGAAPK